MKKKGLTPRQKNLVKLMPQVEEGELTKKEAMMKAGYKESSATQQSVIFGGLRNNTRMQEALRKAGFTEDYLAEGVMDGTGATFKGLPDYKARGVFYKLGAELLDAFPAQKNINAEASIADLIKSQESSTPS